MMMTRKRMVELCVFGVEVVMVVVEHVPTVLGKAMVEAQGGYLVLAKPILITFLSWFLFPFPLVWYLV
jgi:hypothetical protein